MYYLILVSYVCYHYLLKHLGYEKIDLMQKLNISMNLPHSAGKNYQKVIFYITVAIITALYLGIYIVSVVYEVSHKEKEENNPKNSNSFINYCSCTFSLIVEIWYLILNVICVVLSIVVVVVIEVVVEESAEIDDAAAERLLTTLSKGVTHVIWQIDRLMGGTIEDEPIADELKAIAANSAEGDDDALFDSLYAFATQQHDTIQSGNNTSE